MADEKEPFHVIQDSEVSKNEKLSFAFMLQGHLRLISMARSQMTTAANYDEKILTFNEQVDFIIDCLSDYQDDRFRSEMTRIESHEDDPMQHVIAEDGDQILVSYKLAAMDYIRKKFQAVMSLMARKNLLLTEDGTSEM
jgi:hypothetical protein